MTRRRIDRLCHSGCRSVALAVVRRAKVRAAFHNFSWNSDVGHAWIEASMHKSAGGIYRCATRTAMNGFLVRLVPIRGPFPDVADHVVEPISVGWKRTDRRRPLKAIG